jgi:hypothetical protein
MIFPATGFLPASFSPIQVSISGALFHLVSADSNIGATKIVCGDSKFRRTT